MNGNITVGKYSEIVPQTIEEIYMVIDNYNEKYCLPRAGSNTNMRAFYRGQNNSQWIICPSVARDQSKRSERDIYNDNKNQLKGKTLFSQIAYLQHYCVGTRFIDFSLKADVALFFACNENFEQDGALFLYCYDAHESNWVDTEIITELITMNEEGSIQVNDFSKRLLSKYVDIRERFTSIEELNLFLMGWLDQGFMVLPSNEDMRFNKRLKNQEGVFFICGMEFENEIESEMRLMSKAGDNRFLNHSVKIPDSLINSAPLVKCIIKKELKRQMLERLDKKDINDINLLCNDVL